MSLENFKYNLQRLKHCDQYWDDMELNEGGRHCAKCSKTIVDFSGMSFTEIALFMSTSSRPVCGFYLPEQLKEINSPIPKLPLAIGLSTFIATAAVAESPVSLQSTVQTTPCKTSSDSFDLKEKSIEKKSEIDTFWLSGQVVYFDTATSSSQPIPFASIMVKGTVYGVTADEEGNFKLGYSASDTSITILINSVGFEPYELANISLNDNKAIDLGVIKMELGKWELIEFVVSRKRNIFSRFWRMITKPFRKM